jgi:ATP-dependent Clp protease ATP-binding subunit ClpX
MLAGGAMRFLRRHEKSTDGTLRCSFCRKPEDVVGKLISNYDYPRAYICDECVMVCCSILEYDEPEPTNRPA